MLQFSRWKISIVLVICVVAAMSALPSFLTQEARDKLPSWMPNKAINLGLDLRGGSQLLLEVDFASAQKDQFEMLQDMIKSELYSKKIGYLSFRLDQNALKFSLRDISHVDQVRSLLKKIDNRLLIDRQDTEFVLQYNNEHLKELEDKIIDQSIEIIRRRVDETGTKEPSIQRQGLNYILLQVPGLDNPEHLKNMLGKTAKLGFHLVDTDANIEAAVKGHVPAGTMLMIEDRDKTQPQYYLLKKKIILSGDRVADARAVITERNQSGVSVSLDALGAKQFSDFTKQHVEKYIAIVLDNKIISVARINEPITGGQSIISGNFTTQAANELALLLRAGALPAPLSIAEERTVGPNLGADSIESGKKASLVSLVMIMIFMVVVYGLPGMFASLALIVNLVLIAAALSWLQATLTMPGIAGIILTMGMAVDANVLIFERVREELRNGMSSITATERGFRQAFTTIIDSNITTILVAILLFSFGSGVVKGFAVTLVIGILASMFSAITLTRLMMSLLLQYNKKARFLL